MKKNKNVKNYLILLIVGALGIFAYWLPIFAIAINRHLSMNNAFLLLQGQFPEVIDILRCYLIIGSMSIGYSITRIIIEKINKKRRKS